MPVQVLTPREFEISQLVCQGLSNKEIAIKLDLAEGTVKLHLHRTFAKLGIKRRIDLHNHISISRSGFSLTS